MQGIAFNMLKKEVTIYDLAHRLRLSTATISRALNDDPMVNKKTRKNIQEIARELGYRRNEFAKNLRNQKTNTIGVIVHELNSHFITSVLAGIEKVTTEAGYDIVIAHSSESYKKEISNALNLFHKRVDGLIASLAFTTQSLDHFDPFKEKGIPLVFFDRVEENSPNTNVIIDNYRCGYQATLHLIEQGCKKIVLVTASLQRNVYAQRHQGYAAALADHGLPYQQHHVLIKDLSEEGSIEAAQEILQMPERPDGIFLTNDFSAAICMQTLKEQGIRIPQDMAIVGFNNDEISKITEPKLTTIHYPGFYMGEMAATNIIDRLDDGSGQDLAKTITVRSELIVRASSLRKATLTAQC
jgi:LacI family transcriptional regulator